MFVCVVFVQLIGLKGKLYAKERFKEKIAMKKTIQQHSERDNKHKVEDKGPDGAKPAYLLDREEVIPERNIFFCPRFAKCIPSER